MNNETENRIIDYIAIIRTMLIEELVLDFDLIDYPAIEDIFMLLNFGEIEKEVIWCYNNDFYDIPFDESIIKEQKERIEEFFPDAFVEETDDIFMLCYKVKLSDWGKQFRDMAFKKEREQYEELLKQDHTQEIMNAMDYIEAKCIKECLEVMEAWKN
jgi:hypothetical protein